MTEKSFTFGSFRRNQTTDALVKERRKKIVEMRESGSSFEDIAKVFNISTSRCARLYNIAKNKSSKNRKKRSSFKIASFIRNTIIEYLPLLLLRDEGEKSVQFNYPLLFLVLYHRNDYFKKNKSKNNYIRVVVHSLKPEILISYNKLLAKFNDHNFVSSWGRSPVSTVPKCFWNNKDVEDFLLRCSLTQDFSDKNVENVASFIENILSSSPDFSISDPFTDFASKSERDSRISSFLTDLSDLEQYVLIMKEDKESSREDYLLVLDSALCCLRKAKEALSSTCTEQDAPNIIVPYRVSKTKQDAPAVPIKEKPKAFWPKPKI